jgi:hypothetical protein
MRRWHKRKRSSTDARVYLQSGVWLRCCDRNEHGPCNGKHGTGCQCEHNKYRFDVIASLQRVIPLIEQFRDVTSENDQQKTDARDLEDTAPHQLMLSPACERVELLSPSN